MNAHNLQLAAALTSTVQNVYTFWQTNSDGGYILTDRVGIITLVEAPTAEEANAKAQSLGIYFNGVAGGKDCRCCGDRWTPATEDWRAHPEEIPAAGDLRWVIPEAGVKYERVIHFAGGDSLATLGDE
jgi:hypothetical protein